MRAAFVNKLAFFAALAPAVLWAADVWETKPFKNWSDKDIQKIFNNSPWARQARAVLRNAAPVTAGRLNDSNVPEGRETAGAGPVSSAPSDSDQGPQSSQEI